MNDRQTICPLCGVGCRLQPGTDGLRAQGAVGPANPNGRLCRKGIDAFAVVDEDRLTRPVVRRDSDWRAVSWSAAYDHVVDQFERLLDVHGPDTLGFLGAPHCTNEENYLLQKLARLLGTNNVDNRARHCHVSTTRVLSDRVGWPATTNRLADLSDADVIIVAGANPAERQPIAFNSFVRPAVNEGTTLIHVEPVGNRTTRLADVHIAPRPGMDALMFDLLSARVLEMDGVDRDFVTRRTSGFEAFTATITEVDHETRISVADVDTDVVDDVARLIAGADRVAGMVGTGVEGSAGRTNASEAFFHLLLLTGNFGRRGTGLYVLRGLTNEQGAIDAGCVPDRLPGHQSVMDTEARERIASEWGDPPPSTPGKTAKELLASFGNDIRGALVVGENPAISKRDPEWVRQRLNALDLLVVLDLVSSETTRHADVVLPTATSVEKDGTLTNLERRVQRTRQTVPPPGQARPDFVILRDLGQRLIDARAFDYSTVSTVFDELSRVAPTHTEISYADIDRHGRQWPFDSDGVLYEETFATPNGVAVFGSAQPMVELDAESGLQLVVGGRTSERHDDHRTNERTLRMHPADASERSIESADSVAVSHRSVTVEAPVQLASDLRRGTVYLPAEVADPLLRCETSTVTVRPISSTTHTHR
ncbi:molybdopterin oxidoreductase family protein [Halocatena salina]|uniref:Molybdopterin-dependent oxidoreductase n=1 Tax=Halocatena salina TaxID=2934340 RepID=A0A8U0A9N6_9EURY|nr:molybdopterin-dependent oxidoreductase [Halocatena salina]UPM45178.1 molybdopterin-dependent oxidoreductase [Halocatena salina]